MKNKLSYNKLIFLVLALLLLVSVIVSGRSYSPVYASTQSYTGALEDLQKDSSFNVNDYPDKPSDYSIQVIQIAESTKGELFVYTYQPCQNTRNIYATEINMSLTESPNGTQLYGLVPVSTDGVLCKYRVYGFTVKSDNIRYYNITSIYRKWIQGIDMETGNDNTKNAVAFPVGKCIKAKTINGAVSYSYDYEETIDIINPVAGYLEYSNGFKLCPDWCRSHYIAFSTDKQIDTLMEADVFYVKRSASRASGLGLSGEVEYGEPENVIAPLKGEQKGGNTADGFLAKKYEWERIQSIDEFKADKQNALTDSAKDKLNGAKWVLRFVETTMHANNGFGSTVTYWTDISEVSILRLKFITAGKVYNLGAVSDKVTEGKQPDNTNTNEFATLFEWLSRVTGVPEWVWKLLAVLIPLAILLPVLSIFFPVVGQVLLWVLKGIAWVICSPFRFFKWLFNKLKGGD